MTTPKVKPIPEGMRSVTPHLICAGAADAIEFYKKAFNAVEMLRLPGPQGKLMYACIRIGDHWSVATHVRDVSPDEMQDAIRKMGG